MKKIDLAQSITILANVGVIAGIVFLGVELRQNNALMDVSVRDARNQRIYDFSSEVYSVPGLAEAIQKSLNGEPLTDVEDLKLFARNLRLLRGFEAQYAENIQGTGFIDAETWKIYFNEGGSRNPPIYKDWDEIKIVLSPGFVQFIEENVAEQ